MKNYDLIVLGWGKAGKTLAAKYSSKGYKVAIIEEDKNMYGGTCVNIGCLPTKSLVHSANLIEELGNSFFKRDYEFNSKYYKYSIDRKKEVISKLNNKNFLLLDNNANVDIYNGKGRFISNYEIKVNDEILHSEKIIINTGSTFRNLDIKGINSKYILNSTQILNLDILPKNLLIIGSGFIGLEFASYFANFGSEVDIFQFNDEFLPNEDEDTRNTIKEILTNKNINIKFNTSVNEFIELENNILVKYKTNSEDLEKEYDYVLIAAGRVPNIHNLGLENTDIKTENRAIQVNENLETSVKGIYAAGDVKGGPFFTYISLDDSRIILPQLLNIESNRNITNRSLIPTTTFIDPPYSKVGENEISANKKNIKYTVKKILSATIPKAHLINKTEGFTKLLFDENNVLIGAQVLNYEAHENINFFTLAIKKKLTLDELKDSIYTHPIFLESLNDLN